MTDAEIDALQTKDGQHILKQRDVFERYGSSVNYFIEVRNIEPGVDSYFTNYTAKALYLERK